MVYHGLELVKNIAAVLGLIVTFGAVFSLCSKSFRSVISGIFKRYGNDKEMVEIKGQIAELKDLLIKQIESTEAYKIQQEIYRKEQEANMEISLEFARTQCRNLVKNIFYEYYDEKVLPLYEKKTLNKIEDLYIGKLHGNSFAHDLLKEMATWQVDYNKIRMDED